MIGPTVIDPSKIGIIKTKLVEKVQNGAIELLGSQLGGLVSSAIRPAKILAFGGLKNFTTVYLSDFVAWNRRTTDVPGDDIYSIAMPKNAEIDSPIKEVRKLPGKQFWTFYTNPHQPGFFAKNKGNDGLYFSTAVFNVADGWTEMPRITPALYKSWMKQFVLEKFNSDDQSKALELLEEDSFNNTWVRFLKEHDIPNILPIWEQQRIKKIVEFLRDSLEEHDILEFDVEQLCAELISSRKSKSRNEKRISVAPTGLTKKDTQQLPSSLDDPQLIAARALAHKAIDLMTMDDLRLLRIPLGVLLFEQHWN